MLWADSALLWRGILIENSNWASFALACCCAVDYSVLLACSACSLLITLPCCCAVRWFCPTLKGNPYRKFIVWWITLSCLLQCLFTASKLCLAGGGHKFARLLCCDTGITCLLLLCFEGESLPKITDNSNWASFALACCCAVTLALIVWTFALSWWITALPCIV